MDKMEKLNPQTGGASLDIVAENMEKLRAIFPDVFAEEKVDFEALKANLGEYLETEDERYSFTWNGKAKAKRIAQTSSMGTLRPCKDESVNWDNTQNLFIEGDNLEVLKLLQKSYQNKIKVIYIDPPYNTGKEFIYPDNYQDNLNTYLEYTRQKGEDGKKFSPNAETAGRYHTNWLNMMYPRLRLARNLLKEDGVIFISIGERELINLTKICNEIFGEENFVGTITWKARVKPVNIGEAKFRPQKEVEYVIIYKKQEVNGSFKPLLTGGKRTYPHSLGDRKYRLTTILKSNRGTNHRSTMVFPLKGYTPPEGQRWQAGEDVIRQLFDDEYIEFKDGTPFKRYFEDEEGEEHDPFYCFMEVDWSSTSEAGKNQLNRLIGDDHGFDTVKPVRLIQTLIQSCTDSNGDIVLDFFAGSCTTAHAIFEQNLLDKGNRQLIQVQLPEPAGEISRFDFVTDIGKERICRAGKKILEENKDKEGINKLDIGFKVFKLDSSNIKAWDADFENLEQTLMNSAENIKPKRSEEDLVYELLLKYGLDLTLPIEERQLADKKVFILGFGLLVICFADQIGMETVEAIGKLNEELQPLKPMKVVFKDTSFKDDVVKTNAIQTLRRFGVEDVKSI